VLFTEDAEAAGTVEMAETAANKVQHVQRITRRRKKQFESDFFYYK